LEDIFVSCGLGLERRSQARDDLDEPGSTNSSAGEYR